VATSAHPSGAGDGIGGGGLGSRPTGEAVGGVRLPGSAPAPDSEFSPVGGRGATAPTPAGPRGGRPSAAPAATTAAPTAQGATAAGRSAAAPAAPVPGARAGSPIVLGSFGVGSGPLGALFAPIPVAVRAWTTDVNSRGGLDQPNGQKLVPILGYR